MRLYQIFTPDIDECSSANECHQNSTCHNTKGSYNCTCKDGFEGDGKNCTGKILFRAQPQRAQLQKKNLQKGESTFTILFIFCYHSCCMRMILAVSLGPTQGVARKVWKIQAWAGTRILTSPMPVQCSTNWAIKPTGKWPSHGSIIRP